ncbi:MAG: hypothetical protein AB1798_23475, partial [Spirochaetota bacterium]
RNDISFGYYVRNAICSLNINSRKFVQKASAAQEIVDSLVEYSFKSDIFQKNVPYKILISLGFQQLSKTFIDSSSTVVHTLNSLVIGNQVDIIATEYLTIVIRLDSSLYSFGQGILLGISNPGPGGYLFRATAGATLNLEKIPKKQP